MKFNVIIVIEFANTFNYEVRYEGYKNMKKLPLGETLFNNLSYLSRRFKNIFLCTSTGILRIKLAKNVEFPKTHTFNGSAHIPIYIIQTS